MTQNLAYSWARLCLAIPNVTGYQKCNRETTVGGNLSVAFCESYVPSQCFANRQGTKSSQILSLGKWDIGSSHIAAPSPKVAHGNYYLLKSLRFSKQ